MSGVVLAPRDDKRYVQWQPSLAPGGLPQFGDVMATSRALRPLPRDKTARIRTELGAPPQLLLSFPLTQPHHATPRPGAKPITTSRVQVLGAALGTLPRRLYPLELHNWAIPPAKAAGGWGLVLSCGETSSS